MVVTRGNSPCVVVTRVYRVYRLRAWWWHVVTLCAWWWHVVTRDTWWWHVVVTLRAWWWHVFIVFFRRFVRAFVSRRVPDNAPSVPEQQRGAVNSPFPLHRGQMRHRNYPAVGTVFKTTACPDIRDWQCLEKKRQSTWLRTRTRTTICLFGRSVQIYNIYVNNTNSNSTANANANTNANTNTNTNTNANNNTNTNINTNSNTNINTNTNTL